MPRLRLRRSAIAAALLPTLLFLAEPSRDGPAGPYAGSQRCAGCHPKQFAAWKQSHHARAERRLDAAVDRDAFAPRRMVRHGSVRSETQERDGRLEIVTLGGDGRVAPFAPVRVIGESPLRQFLVPGRGGRHQVTELAFDPVRREWFDVYGEEDRKPQEWGFWASRGMTWNSMCAPCHVTDLRKGYSVETDRYETRYVELGVGCESCHGPALEHVLWRTRHPGRKEGRTAPRIAADRWVGTCGGCHARRLALQASFRAGEAFLDQFRPELPDLSETYYADGQVRDEDYEYVSFLLSRMHAENVRCTDCHEPHRAALHRKGNDLCLRCHQGKIPPGHSRHREGSTGSECINCHMPVTVYMQRHPRRDHGFTIPDPFLTRELGIPNACTRCHRDKTVDWAAAAAADWYGNRLDRPARRRARAVAGARRGDPSSLPELLALARTERSPAWRASVAGLLGRWIDRAEVRALLSNLASDPQPLVRAAVAEALEPAASEAAPVLRRLLEDPLRAVRVQAAWALRREIDLGSETGRELLEWLDQGCDQPAGAMLQGSFWDDRGDPEKAAWWYRRAASWEPRSPAPRQALAALLANQGRARDAAAELEAACRDMPDQADLQLSLGLARAEAGDLRSAADAVEQACRLEPRHARAWYNLGLMRHRLEESDRAVDGLRRAASIEPGNADYPFALAAVLRDLGRVPEAVVEARRAVHVDPARTDARQLLAALTATR